MGSAQVEGVTSGAAGISAGIGAVGSWASSALSEGVSSATGDIASTLTITTTAVTVHSRVDALLASFGSELAGEQQLRMIIALLILNALLGNDDENRTLRPGELAGLASLMDPFARRSEFTVFSATNIIQMQHQSTLVYSDQAIQTASEAGIGGENSSGSRLDVTG